MRGWAGAHPPSGSLPIVRTFTQPFSRKWRICAICEKKWKKDEIGRNSMDYMGFSVDVPGYSPAIFCKSARSPIRRRFLVSWRRAPHPRRTLRALTSVALCIPRKIASSSWVIWGLKSSLSPCRRESPHKKRLTCFTA